MMQLTRRDARLSLLIPAFLALLPGALGLLVAPVAAQRTIPSVPQDVRVAVSATALMLTWQAPSSWGSFPAYGYQIDWAEGASPPAHSSNDWNLISPDPGPTVTKYILTDRTYGTKYHLRIRARSLNPQDNTDGLVSFWVVRSGTPFHTHGPPPGKPTLTATAQTATTLSFSIGCVSPGKAPVTNYELWAEKTADGSVVKHSHTVPSPCVTETVTVPGLESGTTYRVRAYARNLFARNSEWSDWVSATTGVGGSGVSGQSCSGQADKYAALIAKMYEWRNDPQWAHAKAHTDRWDRALLAFGETVADSSLTAMSAAEAQGYADRGWTRWVEVAKALREIEACQTGGDRAPGRVVASGLALALVDGVAAEEAAAALFDGRSLPAARLEALDRLGNANGRYDVGDLLAWIERCRNGGARCDGSPRTPPSAAALPAATAAGAVPRRPRRRTPRGPARQTRRRTGMLTLLCAATLWSCDAAGGPTAAVPPEPGLLTVEWTAPARGPVAAGALVEIDGPHVGDARVAGGLELYATEGTGPRRFVLAGTMRNGAVLEFEVPDKRQAGLYGVRVVEVAGDDHRLLDADRYRAGIASN